MTYPFPDKLDFTLNDIIVFSGYVIGLSIFFICSEDILEWFGIPNDIIDKETRYDRLIAKRSYTSNVVTSITTPIIFANGLRMVTSILGLGPLGGYLLWIYILYLYHSRYVTYDINYFLDKYIAYSICIFTISFVSWVPGNMIYNIQWAMMYIGILCMIRIITELITATYGFISIHPIQHIMWDPLVSFKFYRTHVEWGIRWVEKKRYQAYHED